jgi:hypothetical protein
VHLVFHGPIFAGIFALAYVVGVFYEINIAFYTLFGISDQLVFALQGLPFALGGTVLFLICLSISLHPTDWGNTANLILNLLPLLWIALILYSAYYFFHHIDSLGCPFCFIVLAIGVVCFHYVRTPKESFVHLIYWGVNVAVLCLLVGFVTAKFHDDNANPTLSYVIFKTEDQKR